MKTIVLTEQEYELLEAILSAATDQGPIDEGWKSPELSELVGKVRAAGQSSENHPPGERE